MCIFNIFKKKEQPKDESEEENIYPENAFIIINKKEKDNIISEYTIQTKKYGFKSFYDNTSAYNIGDYFLGGKELFDNI